MKTQIVMFDDILEVIEIAIRCDVEGLSEENRQQQIAGSLFTKIQNPILADKFSKIVDALYTETQEEVYNPFDCVLGIFKKLLYSEHQRKIGLIIVA